MFLDSKKVFVILRIYKSYGKVEIKMWEEDRGNFRF